MSGGFADLMALVGVWLGGRKPATVPGGYALETVAARLSLSSAAPHQALEVVNEHLSISRVAGRSSLETVDE